MTMDHFKDSVFHFYYPKAEEELVPCPRCGTITMVSEVIKLHTIQLINTTIDYEMQGINNSYCPNCGYCLIAPNPQGTDLDVIFGIMRRRLETAIRDLNYLNEKMVDDSPRKDRITSQKYERDLVKIQWELSSDIANWIGKIMIHDLVYQQMERVHKEVSG